MEKQSTAKKLLNRIGVGAFLLTASIPAFAVDGPDFSASGALILAMIAAAGLMGVGIMNAGLAWDVGMGVYKKYLKKGAK